VESGDSPSLLREGSRGISRDEGRAGKKRLHEYLVFEVDSQSHTTCCLTADDETREHDAELFDCEHCPIWAEREKLSEANLQALEAFDLLGRRVVVDFQLAPLVFETLRLRLTQSDARVLVESLDLIYDMRCPVKRPTHG